MNNQNGNLDKLIDVNRVLANLRILAEQGLVSKEQVLAIYEKEKGLKQEPSASLTLQNVLYFIGALIVVTGVGIFVAQFWPGWSQFVKVIFALGASSLLYAVGYYLHFERPNVLVFSRVSFILSALLFPLGIGTFLDLIGISAITTGGLIVNFSLLFIIYFSSYRVFKEDIFLIAALSAASGLYMSFTDFVVTQPQAIPRYYEYRLLLLGVAYFALGCYAKSFSRFIINLLYFFGLMLVLSVSFAFSIESAIWFSIFPFMLVAIFYLSVVLQSRLVLTLGTLFTFIEVGRFTGEFFSGSFGWPLALIIAGVGIMLVGYFSFEVNKRYIGRG